MRVTNLQFRIGHLRSQSGEMPYHTDQACHMPDQHAKRGERFLLFCSKVSASLTCLCIKAPCVCVLWSDPVRMISRLMVPVKRQHLEEGSPPFGLGSCDQKVGGLRLGYALLYFGIGVGALYLKSTNVPLGARGRWAPKSKPAKVTHRPSWPTKAAKPGLFFSETEELVRTHKIKEEEAKKVFSRSAGGPLYRTQSC